MANFSADEYFLAISFVIVAVITLTLTSVLIDIVTEY